MLGAARDFVGRAEFQTSFVVGVSFLALVAVVATAGIRRKVMLPIGGLLITVAFVAAAASSQDLPIPVVAGLALLAIGGLLEERIGDDSDRMLATTLLAAPGAIVLSTQVGGNDGWTSVLVVVLVAVGAPLVADFDRRFAARGWPIALLALSVFGTYFAVPDTEYALVLLGVTIPLVFIGWPVPLASLGAAGAYAAIGTLAWVGAFESRGRPAAFVGVIGCLGLLLAEPAAKYLRRLQTTRLARLPARAWTIAPVALAQLALVTVASRVAGVRESFGAAVIVVAIELGVAIMAL